MPSDLCKFLKECPIYQGKVDTNGTPLAIYKNVFCARGLKGWNNCKHHLDYKEQELVKTKENRH